MSTPPEERFGIRVLFVLGGNHFSIFILGRKTSADVIRFYMTWKRNETKMSRSHGVSLGWVSRPIFLLAKWVSGGLPREPGGKHPGPACRALSGHGSLVLSRAPPLYFNRHPYSLPYRLIFVLMAIELRETSSQGNKEKQGTWPQGGLCHMSLSYAVSWPVCWDNLGMLPTLCSSQQNSLLFLFKSFLRHFSKQLYWKQSLMSALCSEPIMVEIAASLAWISYLPIKVECFFLANDYLLIFREWGWGKDPTQSFRKYFRQKEEKVQEN